MQYPPFVYYITIDEYRKHFKRVYCSGGIFTFDGIQVRFRVDDFNHAFYESVFLKDDTFSSIRAERIDWIKATLLDSNSDRYVGWDNTKKRYDTNRRVALVMGNYVVVIALLKHNNARFITAFVADRGTTHKIRQGPVWN